MEPSIDELRHTITNYRMGGTSQSSTSVNLIRDMPAITRIYFFATRGTIPQGLDVTHPDITDLRIDRLIPRMNDVQLSFLTNLEHLEYVGLR